MKAIIYYCGGQDYIDRETDIFLDYLIGEKEIELSRIPNVGEKINIRTHGVVLEGEVTQIYTWFSEPHKNIKEEAWGEQYGISVSDWEIIDRYDRAEAKVWKDKAIAWHKRYNQNDID